MNDKAQKKKAKVALTLAPVSEKIIQSGQVDKRELWFLLVKGHPVGPYETHSLKKFFLENPEFNLETYITNFEHTKWMPIFKCPHFKDLPHRSTYVPHTENKEQVKKTDISFRKELVLNRPVKGPLKAF